MRGPDGEHLGQLPRAQRVALGDPAQHRDGGPVQRYARHGDQPVVLTGADAQIGDAGEGPFDLDHRGRGGRHGGR
ncbi:hypothetical protein [Streptomyces griseoruber]|uniref:hypothetical protein n=1 Tax=Streptomyces griseoruber TaxID=1943 RepID=UPI0037ADFFB5